MSAIQELVLARFLTLYGEPKTDNLESFIAEYEAALAGMGREVLISGANRVIRAQEFRSWPTPGECVKACHAEAERMAIERERFSPKNIDEADRNWTAPTEESKRRVRELLAETKRHMQSSLPPEPVRRSLSDLSKRITGENGG